MKETLEELIVSTDLLFEISHYGSYEDYSKLLKEEHSFYNDLNFGALTELIDIIASTEKAFSMHSMDNYELALYNNKNSMIVRRIYNMATKYFGYCQEIFVPTHAIKLEKNKFLKMKNIEGSMNEMFNKIMANIDIKFLYFMLIDNEISNEKKGLIIANLMFLNPDLQEKIMAPKIMFEPFIQTEDELYNGLWENIKNLYDVDLFDCCYYGVKKNIIIMLSRLDKENNENTLIRKCYLRSLLNFLDEETLEELNYDFNKNEFDVENDFGYKCVKDAFKSIKKDNETINKIKKM